MAAAVKSNGLGPTLGSSSLFPAVIKQKKSFLLDVSPHWPNHVKNAQRCKLKYLSFKALIYVILLLNHSWIECSDIRSAGFIAVLFRQRLTRQLQRSRTKLQSDWAEKVAGFQEECGSSRRREHKNGFFHGAGWRENCLSVFSVPIAEISGAETAQFGPASIFLSPTQFVLLMTRKRRRGICISQLQHVGCHGVTWRPKTPLTSLLFGSWCPQQLWAAERGTPCSNHDEHAEKLKVGSGLLQNHPAV